MTLDPAVAAVRLAVRRRLRLAAQAGEDSVTGEEPGQTVLVACSGGADSLALLAATIFETRRTGTRVVGAVVDHALQGGSAEHTARVVQQMAELGVDETASIRVTVDVAPGGVEAGARQARYVALGQLAAHFGAGVVLLGHTRDDQAETVLLGLARGSGGRSLSGMRPGFVDDGVRFERPLLEITRTQTEAACRAEGIDFWTDPHNSDPRFLRARVRHEVLPVLERALGPGVAETLARTAGQVRDDVEALDAIAAEAFLCMGTADGVPVSALREEPRAVATRVLRLAALEAGAVDAELFHVHVTALMELADGNLRGEVQLPGHVTAHLASGHIAFRRTGVARA